MRVVARNAGASLPCCGAARSGPQVPSGFCLFCAAEPQPPSAGCRPGSGPIFMSLSPLDFYPIAPSDSLLILCFPLLVKLFFPVYLFCFLSFEWSKEKCHGLARITLRSDASRYPSRLVIVLLRHEVIIFSITTPYLQLRGMLR